MLFSIIIPTYQNFKYFKLTVDSIKKNSSHLHEIVAHINGEDKSTEDYLIQNKLKYTKILTNEKTGLLTSPANPLSLVEAIKKLANSDDLSQKLAEENYQNINNNFDLNKTLKQTEEVYGKLL